MHRLLRAAVAALLAAAGFGATCDTRPPEIDRERAIAVARAHVAFEAVSAEAEKAREDGRRVWRVTFRGKPMSPDHPLLHEATVVIIDRTTGDLVSLARP